MQTLIQYLRLMRFHQPVGIGLLLWPTLWAVWLAGHGTPSGKMVIIFTLGSVIMRAAGCVINDIADRKIDLHVVRTASRPLASGCVTLRGAIIALLILLSLAASLAWTLGLQVVMYGLVGVGLTLIYPFCKRYIDVPQLILGLAFAWAIPMAFVASQGHISAEGWVLFGLVMLWPLAYDTYYAMADRADDERLGVHSLARLLGEHDLKFIACVELIFFIGLACFSWFYSHSSSMFWVLISSFSIAVWGWWQARHRQPSRCLLAFKLHQWMGLLLWLGFVFS